MEVPMPERADVLGLEAAHLSGLEPGFGLPDAGSVAGGDP
jgi:hypothetical protein